MFKEIKGPLLGANITGGEGGSSGTHVVCDNLDSRDYALSEVDTNGAVVKIDNERPQRLPLTDNIQEGGVVIHLDANNNDAVKPRERKSFQIGPHTVVVEGTYEPGIRINGQPATSLTPEIQRIRYPRQG